MKKRNRVTRIVTVLLAVLFLVALPLSVSAQGVDSVDGMDFPVIEGYAPLEGSDVQPRGFTRNYSKYLTSSSSFVMSDSNWYGENVVLVQFNSSNGPSQISVYVIDGGGNTIGPTTISLSRSAGFLLKSVAGSFEVYARKTAGYDGNVNLSVTLTSTYA